MYNSYFSPNERKIFVGNLPYNITKDQFRNYFSQFGHIESADILKNENKKSNGCGFIVFSDIRSITAVLSHNDTRTLPKLGNRIVYARRYDPDYEKWSPNIIIHGLPPKTCSKSLMDRLSAFGPVLRVDVTTPGIGYATFKHKADARKCVEKSEILLDNQQVEVSFHKGNEKSPRVRTPSNKSTSPSEPSLVIKDLHHSINQVILQRHFAKYGSNTAIITRSKTNKRQFAHVSFTGKNALEKALGDDHCINGFKLIVERKITMKSNKSSAGSLIDKVISFCSRGKLVCSLYGIGSGTLPLLTGCPHLSVIALFLLFIYLHHENVFGMKDRKYLLPGAVLIFFVAMFLTTYVANSFGFREFFDAKVRAYFSDENHLRRRNW